MVLLDNFADKSNTFQHSLSLSLSHFLLGPPLPPTQDTRIPQLKVPWNKDKLVGQNRSQLSIRFLVKISRWWSWSCPQYNRLRLQTQTIMHCKPWHHNFITFTFQHIVGRSYFSALTHSDLRKHLVCHTAQCAFCQVRWPCGQKLKTKNTLSDGKKIFLRLFFLCCFRKKTLKLVSLFIFRH